MQSRFVEPGRVQPGDRTPAREYVRVPAPRARGHADQHLSISSRRCHDSPMGFLNRLLGDLGGDEPKTPVTDPEQTTHMWTNHAGGYFVCSHSGCQKKANTLTITDHDCCGRCRRGRECIQVAMANYEGPGTFAHRYEDSIMNPGVCSTCGEPSSAH